MIVRAQVLFGWQMSETYENLVGAKGRERFFRPTRKTARDVFPGATPVIWFGDQSLNLKDISINGLGVSCPRAEMQTDASEAVKSLRLTQRGREIFSGKARAARVSPLRSGSFIGLALEGDQFDLGRLAKDNARAFLLGKETPDAEFEIPAHYKEFCSDVHAFLGGYLDRVVCALEPIGSSFTEQDKNEIFQTLYDDIKQPFREILCRGNDLVIPYHEDRNARQALKRYTEKVITRDLVKGPTWWRSYFKPLGYPGDFALMNYMYDENAVGDSFESLFMHALGLVAGRPIVSRMFTLGDILVEESQRERAEPFRITSIGCGPAREFENIFERVLSGIHWEVTLVDQEPLALEYALSSCRRLMAGKPATVTALNMSFTEMLSPAQGMVNLPPQDVYYSLGLVDYLSLPLAVKFTSRLYDALQPGGKVIIANVNNLSTGITWQAEYVTDWTLYFRSKDEMLAMAQGVPDAKVEIVEDEIRSVYFLVVTKPDA